MVTFCRFHDQPRDALAEHLFQTLPLLIDIVVRARQQQGVAIFPQLLLDAADDRRENIIRQIRRDNADRFARRHSVTTSLIRIVDVSPGTFLLAQKAFIHQQGDRFPDGMAADSIVLL